MKKTNLIGKTVKELEQFVVTLGEQSFRGRQLFSWIYAKAVRDFSEMTDLSKTVREKLKNVAQLGTVQIQHVALSQTTGTKKYLCNLSDGKKIESVFIPEGKRRTLCISSQVGCSLGCTFCATGSMGFQRNLSVGEIVDQVLCVEHDIRAKITNVVFMGMGEPLLNYQNVVEACDLIADPHGIAISPRRIVISTAGVIPGIKQFADDGRRYRLAISLNSPDDQQRGKIMPIAQKYTMRELIDTVKYYYAKTRHRPTFEYVLIDGVNNSTDDAGRLKSLLKGFPCKINLIPFNPVDSDYNRPSYENIEEFHRLLLPLQAPIIIRWSKGDDISAACGQLAAFADTEK